MRRDPGHGTVTLTLCTGQEGGAPDEPVGHGHLVQVGLRPVEEVGVGSPDPVQELPVQHQLVHLLRHYAEWALTPW